MKSKTFNMSLPADLLKEVDLKAKEEYRNRSELIKEAIKKYMDDAQEWDELLTFGKKKGKKLGIKSPQQVDKIVRQYRHGNT